MHLIIENMWQKGKKVPAQRWTIPPLMFCVFVSIGYAKWLHLKITSLRAFIFPITFHLRTHSNILLCIFPQFIFISMLFHFICAPKGCKMRLREKKTHKNEAGGCFFLLLHRTRFYYCDLFVQIFNITLPKWVWWLFFLHASHSIQPKTRENHNNKQRSWISAERFFKRFTTRILQAKMFLFPFSLSRLLLQRLNKK